MNDFSLGAPFTPDASRNFRTGLPLPSPDRDPPDSVGGPAVGWVLPPEACVAGELAVGVVDGDGDVALTPASTPLMPAVVAPAVIVTGVAPASVSEPE